MQVRSSFLQKPVVIQQKKLVQIEQHFVARCLFAKNTVYVVLFQQKTVSSFCDPTQNNDKLL